MRWVRFRVRTNVESEDILIAQLTELGLTGAQIEDAVPLSAAEKEQMFTDDLSCADEAETGMDLAAATDGIDGDEAVLSFYVEWDAERGALRFPEETDTVDVYGCEAPSPAEVAQHISALLDELRSYSDIGDGTVSVDVTEDLDWINNWKQFFKPFSIDDIRVMPSWWTDELPGDGPILRIDPGTAFGTGQHESTRLAIRVLRERIRPGDRVLDVGTGSGILSVVALLSGASLVRATDLDVGAIPAVADNLTRNELSDAEAAGRFRLEMGNVIDNGELRSKLLADGPYDIVVANILPYVLVPLTAVVPGLIREGGVYITSGILIEKSAPVRAAMEEAHFTKITCREDGEWCSLTGMYSGER